MLNSIPSAAVVVLGLSHLTQTACGVMNSLQIQKDETLACKEGEHMSLLQVHASRANGRIIDESEVDKDDDELMVGSPDMGNDDRDSDDHDFDLMEIEDYDEADEDEDLGSADLGSNLSLMAWPWSWLKSPGTAPDTDTLNEPTSLMERPVSAEQVSHCTRKMADLVGGLHGASKGPIAHTGSDGWAISKAMFEFLGRVSRKELVGPDKVVCETGFRYGTSAMAFLCMGNASQVRAYSRHTNEFVHSASKLIDKEYPSQLTFVSGDSKQTIRDSLGVDGWTPCDIAFVAGGSQQRTVKEDIANFAKWAKPGSLLMVDHCGKGAKVVKGPRLAFDQAVTDGVVFNASYYSNFTGFKKTICMGRYSGKEATMVQAYLEASGSKGD
mmetsp:Transcript_50334/g.93065  ORF Transcript_50334/g.93065 Transcript_50334/m.93065 type:complete len:383 (+) Transcript_50334:41-1189(+)